MSSSNLLQATAPSVINTSGVIGTGGYTLSGGFTSAIRPSGNITFSDGSKLASSVQRGMSLEVTNSEPSIQFYEQTEGGGVKVTFEPDNGMSSSDLAKIMTLIMVAREATAPLKPISYIRKHNLERHFRFEQA